MERGLRALAGSPPEGDVAGYAAEGDRPLYSACGRAVTRH